MYSLTQRKRKDASRPTQGPEAGLGGTRRKCPTNIWNPWGLAGVLSTQIPSGGADEELEGVDSCVRQKSSSWRFKEAGERKVMPDKGKRVEKEKHVWGGRPDRQCQEGLNRGCGGYLETESKAKRYGQRGGVAVSNRGSQCLWWGLDLPCKPMVTKGKHESHLYPFQSKRRNLVVLIVYTDIYDIIYK